MMTADPEHTHAAQGSPEGDDASLPPEKSGKKGWFRSGIASVAARTGRVKEGVKDYYRSDASQEKIQWLRNKTLSIRESELLEKYGPLIERTIRHVASSAAFDILADELIIARFADLVIAHLPPHAQLVLRRTGMDRLLTAALSRAKAPILRKIAAIRLHGVPTADALKAQPPEIEASPATPSPEKTPK
ncbi:hypothetical protein CFR75_08980 [Komagataeibacter xylinus]|uniref:Uncharacterized protein n=1 Tax=Komagataeibacter xylinus TaxID=28448 RepID=A0A318PL69_KOMXY|nr:hypothetical protein [Komagataeibacter xylinus]PYD56780.1 hypothetical protein CFR75_08980 [Komagataeibacter xylinus]GBQ66977.1 hypothetical protein AA15237_0054 [Komagataeibacter xylinus NBRC 15237]